MKVPTACFAALGGLQRDGELASKGLLVYGCVVSSEPESWLPRGALMEAEAVAVMGMVACPRLVLAILLSHWVDIDLWLGFDSLVR